MPFRILCVKMKGGSEIVQLLLLSMCWSIGAHTQSKGPHRMSKTRLPTWYPENFLISFVTNVTQTDKTHPISGKLFYDWSIQSQRIDHYPGAYECVHFYQTQHRCSLYFLPQGMYRILHDEDDQVNCCLDLPNIRTPAPDWASTANPTFNGLVNDPYTGMGSYLWTFDQLEPPTSSFSLGTSKFHTTSEVASGKYAGHPLQFSFPGKAAGRQDYHFLVGTMTEISLPASLFELPEGCAETLCARLAKS